ncbi:MAG: hypothetical protein E7667_04100 [Ruminococcaceae bacterium]|nr:hypothetical protein [Oscillospiraceae bacterium]
MIIIDSVKKHKKLISIILCIAILLSVGGIFAYCTLNKAPELSEVKDRYIFLIERSKQINEVLFGAGLPVYERDGDLDEAFGIYIGSSNLGYRKVMPNAQFFMIDQMKREAQQVYSSGYCDALFQSCFDGVLVDGKTLIEYTEIAGELHQNMSREVLSKNEKIYLYSTMEIVRPSNKEYVNVEIDAYPINNPSAVKRETLSFSFEEGNWYLDTPTY